MLKNLPLTCPCDKKKPLIATGSGYKCSDSDCIHAELGSNFPIVNNVPVLISEQKTDTVCSIDTNAIYVKRSLAKYAKIKKFVVGESTTTKNNCHIFVDKILKLAKKPKVLIIGSGEKGAGTDPLWNNDDVEIHGIDIYGSSTVDVICDAHYLPIDADAYDGVWIQAVLEHVVEPNKVVSEIHRVLKKDGVVYAETPFMQQVHEGAYDFTRFTVLGHRYLFKQFEGIEIGGNKGPEVVFAWATRYLIWSISRSRKLGRIAGVFTGLLLRPLQFLVSRESLFDASSGVYFMGVKREGMPLTHKQLVELYKGQF